MKTHFFSLALLIITQLSYAQNKTFTNQELFDNLKEKDNRLFNEGFNNCDSMAVKELTSENFEFYHDKSGITNSKVDFVNSMKGLCNMNYKPIRKLVEGSLEIFPLKNNGVLYGAIQRGVHEFYALEKDKPMYLTSTAKFTTLWILEKDEWKMKRVLSFDHQVPK